MMRNVFQIGRGCFGKTLKENVRHKHLFISSKSNEAARLFWLKLLQIEFSQSCSSIIVTRDKSLASKVGSLLPETKSLYYVDPDRKESLSINPLFHSDAMTAAWLTDFFFSDDDESVRDIFKMLVQHTLSTMTSERSIFYVYCLAAIGRNQLAGYFQSQNSPAFIAAKNQLQCLSRAEQDRALLRILGRLSFLKNRLVQRVTLKQKFYAPILFHEPCVAILYFPPEEAEGESTLKLLALSVAHQMIAYPKKDYSSSIYLHVDGIDVFSDSLLNALRSRRVGVVTLSDSSNNLPGYYFQIHIEDSKRGVLSAKRKVRPFRPVAISTEKESKNGCN